MLLIGILIGAGVFFIERKLLTRERGGTPMTEGTVEEQAVKATIHKSEMLVMGGIGIHNVHLASGHLLATLGYILNKMEPDSGLFSIVLDETNHPRIGDDNRPVYGMMFPDSMSMVINLAHHFNEAYNEVTGNEECLLSARALTWHSLLTTIFHEIYHAKRVVEAGEGRDNLIWDKTEEDFAQVYAKIRMFDLAKETNIEIGPDPYFDPLLADLREMLEDEEDEWAIRHRRLHDENVIYSDDGVAEEPIDIMTFKEYLRLSSDDKDDPSWGKDHLMKLIDPDEEQEKVVENEPKVVENEPLVETEKPPFEPDEPVTTTPPILLGAPMPTDEVAEDLGDQYLAGFMESGTEEPGVAVEPEVMAPNTVIPTDVVNTFTNPVEASLKMGNKPIETAKPPETVAQDIGLSTLSVEEQTEIVKQVYLRLYNHVFTKCGFDPVAHVSFNNAAAVLDSVSIADIPNVEKVFLAMDTVDEQGRRQNNAKIAGSIKGQVFGNSGLPGYWLWLNVNGRKMKRTLVPQNPNKLGDGGFPTVMAQRVREGWAVAWIIADNPDPNVKRGDMKAKIETRPGQATTYTPNPFQK